MSTLKTLGFLAVLGLTLWPGGHASRAQEVSEYTVKAAYLVNFVKFITWPDKVYDDDQGAIVIGILGDDPFGATLDDMVKGRFIEGHIVLVRRFASYDETQKGSLRKCHLLFIAYSEKDRLRDILKAVQGSPVLTVSEIERFPLAGGMIQFDQEGQRITLDINPAQAQKAGLTLSSKLLQIAKIYRTE